MFAASKSGRVAATTDPYFPYVPLLLETTSTNGQQNNTFLDSSTNNFTITRNGTPTQGSVTPYWPNGYWSNYFNGSSDYLSLTNSASLNPGTGNFTFECWVYFSSLTRGNIYDGANNGISVALNASNQLSFSQSNVAFILNDTVTPNLNQWYHLAISRSGTTLSMFKNGTRIATATNSTNFVTSTANRIGWNGITAYFNGYISNIRLIIGGTPIYDPTQTTITVPTSPLTAITNTALLTCQSNRFIDNGTANSGVGFPITVNGTPKVQAFQPFSPTASYTTALYGGSGYFGSGSDSVTTPANTAFAFGTSDFTIEAWVYTTVSGTYRPVFYSAGTSSSANGVQFFINTSNQLSFTISFVAVIATSTGTISLNTWNHVAVTRNGTSLRLFINGNIDGTATNSTNIASTTTNYVGASSAGTESITGYISNLRVVKGTAVYTAAFTPPTTPLTAITNTSLLTNFSNAGIYDAAVQNNQVTVGDAQASTTQSKWSPTSMKFDGTGDWLTSVDSPQLQLLSGDFTIEGWVYLSATGVAYGIISKGTASTGWSVNVTSGNKLQFSYTASNLTGATSLSSATWYYFAVVRSGSATGNLKVYLNGTADATSGGAVTDNFNQTDILYVGASRTGTTPLNGYLQDVRMTKGFARTITTPTAAFPTR